MEPPSSSIKRSFLDYIDDIVHLTEQTAAAINFRYTLNSFHSVAINAYTDSRQLRFGYYSKFNFYQPELNPTYQVYTLVQWVPTFCTLYEFDSSNAPYGLTSSE